MNLKFFKCYFWHIATLTIMVVIFMFSAQSGGESSASSSKITELILGKPNSDYLQFMLSGGIAPYDSIEGFIRKCAHFGEYALLGFCITKSVFYHSSDIEKHLSISILMCALYALSDEIHQYFVPNRSCEIADVLIDISGAITGIFAALLFQKARCWLKYKINGGI